MRETRWQWALGSLAAVTLSMLMLWGRPASALIRYGPIQISGNIENQELIRHQSINELQWVQSRNTLRLRFDYDWLEKGVFLGKFNTPWLERSKLFLLYRGVYDAFYGAAPGGLQHGQTRFDDIIGGSISKNMSSSTREHNAFENSLREAYIDMKFANIPLSIRAGRQQVIWGESDQIRIMDLWNPIDYSWHAQQESWDNLRIPQWMIKGLWDIGQVGPISNAFAELVWNPGDWVGAVKFRTLPNPWSVGNPDPLRLTQVATLGGPELTPVLTNSRFDLNHTNFFHGTFSRNPQDASEVGLRFHGVTPFGLEFAPSYMYARARGASAANGVALQINKITLPFDHTFTPTSAPTGMFMGRPVFPVTIDGQFNMPYEHIFGLTGNYADQDWTNAVLRFEGVYLMGSPFATVEPDKLPTIYSSDGHAIGHGGFGYDRHDVFSAMIGFDRPTWIRWLNSKNTFFITGQIITAYTTGNVNWLRGSTGAGDSPYISPKGTNAGVAQWESGPYKGMTERIQDGTASSGDDIRAWEFLGTIAMSTFYRGGTLVPMIADAPDFVNGNNLTVWSMDWFVTNDLIVTPFQKFYYTFGSRAVSNDPWGAAGQHSRRDETGLKVTYQF